MANFTSRLGRTPAADFAEPLCAAGKASASLTCRLATAGSELQHRSCLTRDCERFGQRCLALDDPSRDIVHSGPGWAGA